MSLTEQDKTTLAANIVQALEADDLDDLGGLVIRAAVKSNPEYEASAVVVSALLRVAFSKLRDTSGQSSRPWWKFW